MNVREKLGRIGTIKKTKECEPYEKIHESENVESTMPGTHELFVGKVESVHVDEEYIGADGSILWDKMDLI